MFSSPHHSCSMYQCERQKPHHVLGYASKRSGISPSLKLFHTWNSSSTENRGQSESTAETKIEPCTMYTCTNHDILKVKQTNSRKISVTFYPFVDRRCKPYRLHNLPLVIPFHELPSKSSIKWMKAWTYQLPRYAMISTPTLLILLTMATSSPKEVFGACPPNSTFFLICSSPSFFCELILPPLSPELPRKNHALPLLKRKQVPKEMDPRKKSLWMVLRPTGLAGNGILYRVGAGIFQWEWLCTEE